MLSKNDLAGRLLKLFAGNENHHGTHGEPQPRPGTLKMDITITAKTVMGPATLELWQTHLDPNETKPLGIIPICKDGLCWWGCIDIDKYDINLIQIIARIERVKLPLVCARSKSGGLRCYLFLSAPQPAAAVQAVLRAMAVRIEQPEAEVFPKQSLLQEGAKGNWLAMPYGPTFGGKIREQVGLKRTGSEMDPPEFIRMAEGKRLTADQFKELDRLEKETRKKQEKKWGPTDPERIKSALKAIDPDITRPDWFAIGCALCSEMGEEGLKLWDEWSKSGSKYDPKSMSRDRADIAEAEGFAYTIRTVFHFAKLAGWKDNKKRAKKIAEAENWEPPPRDDGRPTIKVYGGGLVAIADEGMKALLASGLPIFQRSDHLVRPIIAEVDAADGRKTHTAHLAELDQTYTRDILGRAAVWIKFNKTERVWVPTDPPHETAATIRARKGEWEFPRITGIISTPTMRPDGTLLTEPGYDASTGLLLHHPPEMPPIPEQPTREDALKALELLEGLLGEFPFIEDEQGSDAVARSVALSALITPVIRGAFPVTPAHCATSPVAGSGKSFLFDTVSYLAMGEAMPVISRGASEEELEKRLGSALMAGQPLISIDNVNGELAGDALCQSIDRPVVHIRILGKSELMRIEACSSIFLNGNNITVVGDLCRRTITIGLDPRMEQPELRQFEGNPVRMVMIDRGKYIAAALTICRAYVADGRPNRATPLASFEGWSDTVRSALLWLGKGDPVASMVTTQAEDPVRNVLADVLRAWADIIGTGLANKITLAQVIKVSDEPDNNLLYAAIQAAAGGYAGMSATERSLGLWARGVKGRFVDGLRLMNIPILKGKTLWWVDVRRQHS